MREKLKPCPFCGSDAELRAEWITDKHNPSREIANSKYVRCQRCFARTDPIYRKDIERTGIDMTEEAIRRWNKRTPRRRQSEDGRFSADEAIRILEEMLDRADEFHEQDFEDSWWKEMQALYIAIEAVEEKLKRETHENHNDKRPGAF